MSIQSLCLIHTTHHLAASPKPIQSLIYKTRPTSCKPKPTSGAALGETNPDKRHAPPPILHSAQLFVSNLDTPAVAVVDFDLPFAVNDVLARLPDQSAGGALVF